MNEHLMDWQKGNESKLTSMDRLMYHQEWLKTQHQEVKKKILDKQKVEEPPVVGFVKD